jgi:hypothetical protein
MHAIPPGMQRQLLAMRAVRNNHLIVKGRNRDDLVRNDGYRLALGIGPAHPGAAC